MLRLLQYYCIGQSGNVVSFCSQVASEVSYSSSCSSMPRADSDKWSVSRGNNRQFIHCGDVERYSSRLSFSFLFLSVDFACFRWEWGIGG